LLKRSRQLVALLTFIISLYTLLTQSFGLLYIVFTGLGITSLLIATEEFVENHKNTSVAFVGASVFVLYVALITI
ncbi:hypothetical protein, partial [Marinilactibacillus psychrotolerans]|uniref:hypothetical protein n=1 Tax=Marinilactibacillus psychrotolerans TaxID=191770 RepID=UPI001C98F200